MAIAHSVNSQQERPSKTPRRHTQTPAPPPGATQRCAPRRTGGSRSSLLPPSVRCPRWRCCPGRSLGPHEAAAAAAAGPSPCRPPPRRLTCTVPTAEWRRRRPYSHHRHGPPCPSCAVHACRAVRAVRSRPIPMSSAALPACRHSWGWTCRRERAGCWLRGVLSQAHRHDKRRCQRGAMRRKVRSAVRVLRGGVRSQQASPGAWRSRGSQCQRLLDGRKRQAHKPHISGAPLGPDLFGPRGASSPPAAVRLSCVTAPPAAVNCTSQASSSGFNRPQGHTGTSYEFAR